MTKKTNMNDVKQLREMTGAGIMDVKKALDATNGDVDKAVKYLREQGIAKASKKAGRIATEGLTKTLILKNKAIIMELNCETDFVGKNKEFVNLLEELGKKIINDEPKSVKELLKLKINNTPIENIIKEKIAIIGENISLRRFRILRKNQNEAFNSYVHMGGKISVLIKYEGIEPVMAKDIAMHIAAMNPLYLSISDIPKNEIEEEKKLIQKELKNIDKPESIKAKMLDGRLNKSLGELTLYGQSFVKQPSKKVSEVLQKEKGKIIEMVRFEVGEGIEKEETDFRTEVMSQIKK